MALSTATRGERLTGPSYRKTNPWSGAPANSLTTWASVRWSEARSFYCGRGYLPALIIRAGRVALACSYGLNVSSQLGELPVGVPALGIRCPNSGSITRPVPAELGSARGNYPSTSKGISDRERIFPGQRLAFCYFRSSAPK